ncbi:MAG: ribosomal protein S18-alanine N-acetyltransferase [Actinomycetia bacterium]|nr:ribosomal protein S18-alanine N-acetyltransferase [Actinomycetes bacterium]MCP3911965.1 ribosomal protein S18-alanine N-acetyltransferase [Actinomycetes bacterium]
MFGRDPSPRHPVTRELPVVVATMTRRHLKAVQAIEAQVSPRPWSLDLFRSELAQSEASRAWFVARRGGAVVGFAGIMLIVDDGHVTNVAVDPSCRRQGIASHLMLPLCRAAIDRGALNLTLEVRASNTGAHALYRRFGFAPAGVRAGYYPASSHGPAEDALIMWVHDVDGHEFAARLAALETELEVAVS